MSLTINKIYSFNTIVSIEGKLQHTGMVETALNYSLVTRMTDISPEEMHAQYAANLPDDLLNIDLSKETFYVISGVTIPDYLIDKTTITESVAGDVTIRVNNMVPEQLEMIKGYLRNNNLSFTIIED